MQVGDSIRTFEAITPWYSGYGANPSVTVEPNSVWTIAAVNTPAVFRVKGKPSHFFTAKTNIDGRDWTTHLYERDLGKLWEYATTLEP